MLLSWTEVSFQEDAIKLEVAYWNQFPAVKRKCGSKVYVDKETRVDY